MNEELCCINNEGKTAKNKWENDFDFFPALYIAYKKLEQFFSNTLLAKLFKTRQLHEFCYNL